MQSPTFSAKYYAMANPDVEKACGRDKKAGYLHYIIYGMNENRKAY